MAPSPVDIVIVSFNTRELLRSCLHSIEAHASPVEVSVVVVDNGSADGSAEMVEGEFPGCQVVCTGENLGFAAANNIGVAKGTAPFILCMNSDAELTPGALERLVDCFADEANVVAGPRLINPDGTFQPSCRRFPNWLRNAAQYSGVAGRFRRMPVFRTWLSEAEHETAQQVDMVSGACFLIRREYLKRIGGFDDNLFFYEEELDLMLPARGMGKRVCFCREAVVMHHGGASVGSSSMSGFAQRQLFRSKYYVFRKHYGRAYAWLTYLTDLGIFWVFQSAARLRGKRSQAAALAAAARRGWRESWVPGHELRGDRGFFND